MCCFHLQNPNAHAESSHKSGFDHFAANLHLQRQERHRGTAPLPVALASWWPWLHHRVTRRGGQCDRHLPRAGCVGGGHRRPFRHGHPGQPRSFHHLCLGVDHDAYSVTVGIVPRQSGRLLSGHHRPRPKPFEVGDSYVDSGYSNANYGSAAGLHRLSS